MHSLLLTAAMTHLCLAMAPSQIVVAHRESDDKILPKNQRDLEGTYHRKVKEGRDWYYRYGKHDTEEEWDAAFTYAVCDQDGEETEETEQLDTTEGTRGFWVLGLKGEELPALYIESADLFPPIMSRDTDDAAKTWHTYEFEIDDWVRCIINAEMVGTITSTGEDVKVRYKDATEETVGGFTGQLIMSEHIFVEEGEYGIGDLVENVVKTYDAETPDVPVGTQGEVKEVGEDGTVEVDFEDGTTWRVSKDNYDKITKEDNRNGGLFLEAQDKDLSDQPGAEPKEESPAKPAETEGKWEPLIKTKLKKAIYGIKYRKMQAKQKRREVQWKRWLNMVSHNEGTAGGPANPKSRSKIMLPQLPGVLADKARKLSIVRLAVGEGELSPVRAIGDNKIKGENGDDENEKDVVKLRVQLQAARERIKDLEKIIWGIAKMNRDQIRHPQNREPGAGHGMQRGRARVRSLVGSGKHRSC